MPCSALSGFPVRDSLLVQPCRDGTGLFSMLFAGCIAALTGSLPWRFGRGCFSAIRPGGRRWRTSEGKQEGG